MRKYTQNIEECFYCGRIFDNGEDYWKDSNNKCYCTDNKCGWENDEEDEEKEAAEYIEYMKGLSYERN